MNARPILSALLSLLALSACASTPHEAPPSPPIPAQAAPLTLTTAPWTFDGKPGRQITTPSYTLWTTETDPTIIARLPYFLERAMAHYLTWLNDPPLAPAAPLTLPPAPDRLDSFVMATRPQWARLTRQLMGSQAEVYMKIPSGGFAAAGKGFFFNIGAQGTMSVASHEGWHQYTQSTFREPLPLWLEEGIATYMEGHRWEGAGGTPVFRAWANAERFDQLRAAASAGSLLPLSELLAAAAHELMPGNDPHDTRALTYYAQVWALTHFLREGAGGKYRESLARLVIDAAAGSESTTVAAALGRGAAFAVAARRGPAVFVAYFNPDLAQAEREYAAFLKDLTRPGSKGHIVAGESPFGPDGQGTK